MQTRLANVWERIRISFWPIPALMIAAAIALAFGMAAIDRGLSQGDVEGRFGVYSGSADGARGLLQAISASMISVAGVVFSITIAVLSLTSSQFGPRIIRSFIRDGWNQMVLGTFVATFMYSLLVLRTVRTGEDAFVPYVSVTVALLFALASIAVLVFFIHHLATMLIAPNVIAALSGEVQNTVKKVTNERSRELKKESREAEPPPDPEERAFEVSSTKSGYLQSVDLKGLVKSASENDLVLQVETRPGDFVVEGKPLVKARPVEQVRTEMLKEIRRNFIFGAQRTMEQDLEYGVQQLVDVALRALSPSLNDTFTAATCVNHLGAVLSQLAARDFADPCQYDEMGKLRVISRTFDFPGIVDLAFNLIRQNSEKNVAIMIRMLEAIIVVAGFAQCDEDRLALLRQVQMIDRAGRELPEPADRSDLDERVRKAMVALRQHG